MSLWQRFWRGVTRFIPGTRSRSDWDGFKAIDDMKVDNSDEWRDRNSNHV